jgi:hypothetical protein
MDISILQGRIDTACAYVNAVENSLQSNWLQRYELYRQGRLSLPDAIALVHPYHYEHLDSGLTVRGPRTFASEVGIEGIKCKADILWGYECSRVLEVNIAADHLFPYSLGGPTLGSNKLYLCALHNQMKSSDIHLYPWEKGEPVWLSDRLATIWRFKRYEQ